MLRHNEVVSRAALLVLCFAARAQDSSTLSLDNGVQIHVAANFGHPTGEENLTVQIARAGGNSFYRVFRDHNNLAVYAYQLFFDLAGNGEAVRATARRYDDQFESRFPYADGGKPTPTLSTDQELGPLTSGKSADLDLFEIPGMGLHVIDTIGVKIDARSSGALHFSGLRISINGTPVAGSQPSPVNGRFAIFYLPGHGAVILSGDDPGNGFVKAGSVDGNHVRFNVDNDDYDGVAAEPILSDAPGGELWVLHDPNYKPAGNWTAHLRFGDTAAADGQFFVAASDSLSWWLP